MAAFEDIGNRAFGYGLARIWFSAFLGHSAPHFRSTLMIEERSPCCKTVRPTERLVKQVKTQCLNHEDTEDHEDASTLDAAFLVHLCLTSSSGGNLKAFRRLLQRTPLYGAYKALGHYPDYWYWILRGRPSRSPHLLKQKVVREYGEKFGLKTLVETGTYYGEMVAAMKSHFDRIYSIEFVPELAERATRKFARDTSTSGFSAETAAWSCPKCSHY